MGSQQMEREGKGASFLIYVFAMKMSFWLKQPPRRTELSREWNVPIIQLSSRDQIKRNDHLVYQAEIFPWSSIICASSPSWLRVFASNWAERHTDWGTQSVTLMSVNGLHLDGKRSQKKRRSGKLWNQAWDNVITVSTALFKGDKEIVLRAIGMNTVKKSQNTPN